MSLGGSARDVVAIWAPNMPPWAGIALGVMTAGCAVTGCKPAASDEEVARASPTRGLACCSRSLHSRTAVALAHHGGVDEVVLIDEVAVGGATSIFALLEPPPEAGSERSARDAVALVPYSSGTSGLPKGVMLSHRNLVTSLRSSERLCNSVPTTRRSGRAVLPPRWVFVLSLLAPLAAGATVVTAPRFEPDDFVRTLTEHRVTFLAAPPPVAHVLATHPDVEQHHLALELVAFGGAPLASRPKRRWHAGCRTPSSVKGGLTETRSR